MKKLLYFCLALLVLAIVSVSFVSCGGDDDNNSSNPIVGTWCGYAGHKTSGTLVESYTFNEDHTCEHYYASKYKIGTYKISGNTITMNFNKIRDSKGIEQDVSYTWVYSFSISGNELKLSDTEGYDIYYKK